MRRAVRPHQAASTAVRSVDGRLLRQWPRTIASGADLIADPVRPRGDGRAPPRPDRQTATSSSSSEEMTRIDMPSAVNVLDEPQDLRHGRRHRCSRRFRLVEDQGSAGSWRAPAGASTTFCWLPAPTNRRRAFSAFEVRMIRGRSM